MYSIIRIQKLKGSSSISMSEKHINRDEAIEVEKRPGENYHKVGGSIRHVDSNRVHLNYSLVDKPAERKMSLNEYINTDLKERYDKGELKTKVRSNSVKCVEVLMTASPEFFKEKGITPMNAKENEMFKKWADANVSFLKDYFRNDSLIDVKVHLDESTPHIHAHIIPYVGAGLMDKLGKGDNKRLSARDLFGGRKEMSHLQSMYHKHMNDPEKGLETNFKRGKNVLETKAEHSTVKEYYRALNELKMRGVDLNMVPEITNQLEKEEKKITPNSIVEKDREIKLQKPIPMKRKKTSKYNRRDNEKGGGFSM